MTAANRDRAVRSAGARSARLSVSLSGTNLARAADYNQRTVLQAIRLSGETTRVELARQTGLTAPTIANITGRLSDLGLVKVAGRHQGMRGQPALRLVVNPDGAFAVGLNIDRDHLSMALLDLAGNVRAIVRQEVDFASPEAVVAYVREQIDRILPGDLGVRSRVLGVGVAIPDDLGQIPLPHRPEDYARWSRIDVAAMLHGVLPWPIHVDNDAAAAALGEAQRRSAAGGQSFFYLLISAGLGGAPVIDGSYYRGATLRSGEIGLMPDPSAARADALIQDTVSLSALRERLASAGRRGSLAEMLGGDPLGDPVVASWIEDAARSLAGALVSVNCLFNPATIVIGGTLPPPLVRKLSALLDTELDRRSLPSRAPLVPAAMAENGAVIGAAMLPFLDHVLPSDAILIQAGRRG
jgi:predicted NBD/HSP70 family sugar kinase